MAHKPRILHERLAAIVATLRHGEMIFVADAGSGVSSKALMPLAADVEYLDLGVATGVPSFDQVVPAICAVGDIEAAIVAEDMRVANPAHRALVETLVEPEKVYEIPYLPDFYRARDRCKAVVQTGDYSVHANVILVAGYPSADIPLDALLGAPLVIPPAN